MKTMFRGKVVRGKVVVEGTPPPNGSAVTVYVDEPEEFDLTPEQVRLLHEASAAGARGEFITEEELWSRLEKRRLERSSKSPSKRRPISKRLQSGGH
jgi:hypothetical protein